MKLEDAEMKVLDVIKKLSVGSKFFINDNYYIVKDTLVTIIVDTLNLTVLFVDYNGASVVSMQQNEIDELKNYIVDKKLESF